MNIVHIGAGNIGKGFILPVLKDNNKNINFTFLDVNQQVIDDLKKTKMVSLTYLNKLKNVNKNYIIENALTLNEIFEPQNTNLLNNIDLITISIGKENLIKLKPWFEKLAEKLTKKIIVMCCENGNKVSSFFKDKVFEKETQKKFFFVDCVVDRIIPISKLKNAKSLNVEEYYSWIYDANQWPGDVPKLSGLKTSKNIDFEVSKKLYMLNSLHCSLAWYIYKNDKFKSISTIYNALQNSEVLLFTEKYLDECISILEHKFHADAKELKSYAISIIKRFMNKKVDDDLHRVARNTLSKLKTDDRISPMILYAIKYSLNCETIYMSFLNGINYYLSENETNVEIKDNNEILNFCSTNLNFSINEINALKKYIIN
ncbi:hypothetical protein [Mesoplasma corruscae]|uniref:Mannitol-1-phosphate 5-dehydrogenase n=1 Tax=Mesoplasma corruscae TaxID=216874 RepID=A0A2S5RHM4_9MOLU|nr:hypothetical protein [Mesoplasma corruscae]PPE06645.1 mannitol-1-phosphate 5-dehydrogenase [Mesoplasma corruscae]